MALDIANEMCDADFTPSTDVLHSILRAMDECCEFNLVSVFVTFKKKC